MRKKSIKRECPSCSKMTINDDGEFECFWGKSKDRKILEQSKGKLKNCTLKK
jgi:hypothetical protein